MNTFAVALAKDVLSRIRAKKLKTGIKSYFSRTYIRSLPMCDNSQAQPVLDAYEEECSTCALGSLFLSHIRLNNNMTNVELHDVINRNVHKQTDSLIEKLSGVFTVEQLALIEAAYERECNMPFAKAAGIPYADITLKATEFAMTERDSTKRLRKIMRNIVKNKGVFIP